MMILIIPAIEITHGRCACLIQSLPDSPKIYPDDPVEVAKIWRKENAKALYLIDVDGKNLGEPQNWETIERIAESIDIPVIVDGGFKNYESVKKAIELGILRIVVDMSAIKNFPLLRELVVEFTPKRIALKIEAKNGVFENLNAFEVALNAREAGIERVVYKDLIDDEYVNFEALENFAVKANLTNLKVTAIGELSGYPELRRLTEFEKFGVDSIVMSKSLYHNKFPCQYLWRMVESEIDL